MRGAPRTMRAARLHAWGDVRTEMMPVPRPGPGEALVRIDACGVCGTDALVWYVERKAPAVLGHEPVGTVVETGAHVATLQPGNRVFVHHHAPCLRCAECRRGTWSSCATWRGNALDPGGFAEYARIAAHAVQSDVLRLPDSIDDETATFIEPLACCLRAVKRHGAVRAGEAVHVVGLGGMGLLLAQLARVHGAAPITGSDYLAARRAIAGSLGVEPVDPADAAAAVQAVTGGRGADLVLVCPGDPAAIRAGIEAAAPGGRVVCFTPLAPDRLLELDAADLYFREISLHQSYSCGPDETRQALRLLERGALEVRALITHRAGLDGVGEALERAAGKAEGLKTVILPGR